MINQENNPIQDQAAKTSLLKKAGITSLFYVALLFVSLIVFHIWQSLAEKVIHGKSTQTLTESWETIFFVGIVGVIPTMSGSANLSFFLFAPLMLSFLFLLLVVHLLEMKKLITRNKKTFFLIFALILALYASLHIFDLSKAYVQQKEFIKDSSNFKENYQLKEPLESNKQYIYAKKESGESTNGKSTVNKIVVSDIYGNNEKVLFELEGDRTIGEKKFEIGNISPKGNYYMLCDYRECKYFNHKSSSFYAGELCLPEFGKDCPNRCEWSPDESTFLCHYVYMARNQERSALVLFDLSGKHKIVYDTTPYRLGGFEEEGGFAYIDEKSFVFPSQGKMYIANDVKVVSSKKLNIDSLENFTYCNGPIRLNDKIFCYVNTEDYSVSVKNTDQDNFWIEGRNYYILSQTLDQKNKDDYVIVNKAPFEYVQALYSDGDNHLFVADPVQLLSTESGKSRSLEGGMNGKLNMKKDKQLIFYQHTFNPQNEWDEMPRVYLGER